MSSDSDETVRRCLRDVVEEVATQRGRPVEKLTAIFEVARFVAAVERAKAFGNLAPAPQTMQ